jgi:hypothetical protein
VDAPGRGRQMEKVKESKYVMHTVYVYENKKMKPVEIVLRKGFGTMREN